MKNQDKQTVQKVQPSGYKSSYSDSMWGVLPVCLMLVGGILSYAASCRNQSLNYVVLFFVAAASLLCLIVGKILSRKKAACQYIGLIPILVVLLIYGKKCLTGQLLFLNEFINGWNESHELEFNLFRVDASITGIEGAAALITVLQAVLLFRLVYNKHKIGLGIYAFFWIDFMLFANRFSSMACAFLLAGLLGGVMAGLFFNTSIRVRMWMVAVTGVLCITAVWISDTDIRGIVTARENISEKIHELRYGRKSLPEGDLYKADLLLKDDRVEMQLWSEQEKGLYLKGFVGGTLANGRWTGLSNTVYGGDNAGILKWLSEKDFDPLMQSAEYYALSENQPEENKLTIHTVDADRYYFYTPASLSLIGNGNGKERRDRYFTSKGILGQRQYEISEISDSNPSELAIAEEWILRPTSEKQQAYCEAEAVYRNFVYNSYTTVDDGLNPLMQEWFWTDYDASKGGIYSATEQIRKVLSEKLYYTESPKEAPQDENALYWYLTTSREGNAAIYASAAVQAFRSRGIPARYVEGYYVPALAWADNKDGMVEVTGKQAHAWVEVYFDGIGWMPVDVTPGYYYDALKLQQLIGMPNSIHKTAALEDSEVAADEIKDIGKDGTGKQKDDSDTELGTDSVFLGIAAIVILLFTILFTVVGLMHIIRLWKITHALTNNDAFRRIAAMEKLIFERLKQMGIEASLGWETGDIDSRLATRYEQIHPGEYKRVCQLIEKNVYGEIVLEPFEERMLYSFLQKLTRLVNKRY